MSQVSSTSIFEVVKQTPRKLVVIIFYADWHKGSQIFIDEVKQKFELFEEQAILFTAEADKSKDLSEEFKICTVPTIIFTNIAFQNSVILQNITCSLFFKSLEDYLPTFQINNAIEQNNQNEKIQFIINNHLIVIFYTDLQEKKTDELCKHLIETELKFTLVDVKSDPLLRKWLLVYSKVSDFPIIFQEGKIQQKISKQNNLSICPELKFDYLKSTYEGIAFCEGLSLMKSPSSYQYNLDTDSKLKLYIHK